MRMFGGRGETVTQVHHGVGLGHARGPVGVWLRWVGRESDGNGLWLEQLVVMRVWVGSMIGGWSLVVGVRMVEVGGDRGVA